MLKRVPQSPFHNRYKVSRHTNAPLAFYLQSILSLEEEARGCQNFRLSKNFDVTTKVRCVVFFCFFLFLLYSSKFK